MGEESVDSNVCCETTNTGGGGTNNNNNNNLDMIIEGVADTQETTTTATVRVSETFYDIFSLILPL